MELSGKVISVTENTGVKQDGVTEWFRYDVLINYDQGRFPKNAAISFSGKKFDPTILQKCHQQCQMWTQYYLNLGQSVVVANTFTRKWEILVYTKMGVEFEVIEMDGEYKNIHGVPDHVIKQMKSRWEEFL